jgi:hypothetical protein
MLLRPHGGVDTFVFEQGLQGGGFVAEQGNGKFIALHTIYPGGHTTRFDKCVMSFALLLGHEFVGSGTDPDLSA